MKRLLCFVLIFVGVVFIMAFDSQMLRKPYRPGKDYALFFAVSNYKDSSLTNLSNPINDARAVADLLEKSYGFTTEVIADPTLDVIEQKLNEYRDKFARGTFAKDGQLLVFFSGHGIKESNNGYFLPADAEPNRLSRTALAYNIWRPIISEIECQHILVAIDACYSVTFDPTWESKSNPESRRPGELSEAERILEDHKSYRSRIFFTSDAKEDIVPGRSNFVRKLLEGLNENQAKGRFLMSSELFANYVQKAQPTPRANHFEGDDPSSSFLFFPVSGVIQPNREKTPDIDNSWRDMEAYKAIRQNPTVSACQQYLKDFPQGVFRSEVKALLIESQDEQKTSVTKPNLIPIDKISFRMGSDLGEAEPNGASPSHLVSLEGFSLSSTEVTFAEFDLFCEKTGREKPSDEGWGRGDLPVINVSWYGAIYYCNWLSRTLNLTPVYQINGNQVTMNPKANGYRLPTEAEWEAAARWNNEEALFANGKNEADPSALNFDPTDYRRYSYAMNGVFRKRTLPVESLASNNGFYHLSGNVAEWCYDNFSFAYYRSSPSSNPTGPLGGNEKVVRGGSWASNPSELRVWARKRYSATYRSNQVGFRVARSEMK